MNSSILMNRIADDRRCLAHFRGSSHELMIKQGRHYGLPEEYRTCPYCEGCIEDQIHFL